MLPAPGCSSPERFLSTPSARRATHIGGRVGKNLVISIHALREEGDRGSGSGCKKRRISIHALREEGDDIAKALQLDDPISIHALREEGDACSKLSKNPKSDFYPRPPRGGRLNHSLHREHSRKFLSTPSARRATLRARTRARDQLISIHALREEGDEPRSPPARCTPDFYPRPPRGGRRLSQRHAVNLAGISIHALREEGDALSSRSYRSATKFLSTPSARRATWGSNPLPRTKMNFYPRPPRGGRHQTVLPKIPLC